jgi:hypothetical protein
MKLHAQSRSRLSGGGNKLDIFKTLLPFIGEFVKPIVGEVGEFAARKFKQVTGGAIQRIAGSQASGGYKLAGAGCGSHMATQGLEASCSGNMGANARMSASGFRVAGDDGKKKFLRNLSLQPA